ncbi:MAG: biotin/lipoyl-binding protein [Anaerolineales bacterium]|nr:biotin/lipoyl-binding protein [Anaerolineales bacterium]
MKYVTTLQEQDYLLEIIDDEHLRVGDRVYQVDFQAIGDQQFYSLLVDGNSYEAQVFPADDGWHVILQSRLYSVCVEDERDKQLRLASQGSLNPHGEFLLRAPMPGLIVSLPVFSGVKVQKGDVLAVLESMKMQNELRSPRTGVVTRVRVNVGDNVEQKQALLSIE